MKRSTITVLISLITVLFAGCIIVQAKTQETNEVARIKCYKSIEIQSGDTLWSIAKEYMTAEYTSVNEYVKDIQKVNNFTGSTIYEGCYIIVPYYTDASAVTQQ